MRTMQAVLVLLALGAAPGFAQSTVYKWTDKDGKIHFSDAPPVDADAQERRMGGGGPSDANLPFAAQDAARRNPVSLFVTPDCGDPCSQGVGLLEKRGVPYTQRDPQANPADKDALGQLPGGMFVPTLAVGSKSLRG